MHSLSIVNDPGPSRGRLCIHLKFESMIGNARLLRRGIADLVLVRDWRPARVETFELSEFVRHYGYFVERAEFRLEGDAESHLGRAIFPAIREMLASHLEEGFAAYLAGRPYASEKFCKVVE